MLADEMRDPVCDDASLAAARSGEQQQRPFDVRNSFFLLGIEALEEVHLTPV